MKEIDCDGQTTKLLLFFQLLLVVIFSIYMYTKAVLDALVILFWIFFISIVILTSIIVLKSRSYKFQMISLILLVISILAIKLIGRIKTYQMVGTDDFFECGYANTIINTGHWDPTAGLGIAKNYYGYYPAIHFFLSSVSIVSSVNAFIVGKYIFIPLTTILQFLLAYLIINKLFRNYKNRYSITALVMLLYISTIGFLMIHISRRTFADTFFLLALFSLTPKNTGNKNFKYAFVFIISIIMILIGHHFTLYISVLFFGCLFLFSTIYKLKLAPTQKIIFIIFVIVTGLYFVYIIPTVLSRDFLYIKALWASFLGNSEGPSMTVMTQYYAIEKILPFASQGIFILLSIFGFYVLVKNHKLLNITHPRKFFFMFFVTIGLILYIVTGPLIRTTFFFVPISLMVLTGFGMSILFIICLFSFGLLGNKPSTIQSNTQKEDSNFSRSKLKTLRIFRVPNFRERGNINLTKVFFITFIIVIIFAGNILTAFSARYINRAQDEGLVVEDQRNLNDRFYASGLWLKSHILPTDRVVGNLLVFQLYAGYFSIDAVQDWRIFANETVFNNNVKSFSYLVFDRNLMKYPSLISGDPLGPEVIHRLDDCPALDRVYDNGDMVIYKVNRGTE